VGWHSSHEEINKSGNLAVIPCANQVGSHADYGGMAEKFKLVNSKILAIGLGAQSGTDGKIPDVPPGTLSWIREIANHAPTDAPNIAVRGEFTRTVLEHYGFADNVSVMGCPTLFINP